MFDTRVMEYRVTTYGEKRRVHREYVDVVARFGRDGSIEPVTVMWRDGRAFRIDEVVGTVPFGAMERGRQTSVYRVRFGGHETELYLERRAARPAMGEGDTLRWWVYAFDMTKSGSSNKGQESGG